jgi:hypothetical protein
MSNRKTLPCGRCGRLVIVGVEAVACRCWSCVGLRGDPPAAAGLSLEAPHRRDLAECCNYSAGVCLVRERGPCIIPSGGRCGWHERAVKPVGEPSGRVCAECGAEVRSRRRLCDSCRRAAARRAKREWKRRKESRVDSFAPQTANAATNSQPHGGGSDGNGPG